MSGINNTNPYAPRSGGSFSRSDESAPNQSGFEFRRTISRVTNSVKDPFRVRRPSGRARETGGNPEPVHENTAEIPQQPLTETFQRRGAEEQPGGTFSGITGTRQRYIDSLAMHFRTELVSARTDTQRAAIANTIRQLHISSQGDSGDTDIIISGVFAAAVGSVSNEPATRSEGLSAENNSPQAKRMKFSQSQQRGTETGVDGLSTVNRVRRQNSGRLPENTAAAGEGSSSIRDAD